MLKQEVVGLLIKSCRTGYNMICERVHRLFALPTGIAMLSHVGNFVSFASWIGWVVVSVEPGRPTTVKESGVLDVEY